MFALVSSVWVGTRESRCGDPVAKVSWTWISQHRSASIVVCVAVPSKERVPPTVMGENDARFGRDVTVCVHGVRS